MCGTSKATDKAAADQTAWTSSMQAEATQVFGTDTRIVNDLVSTAEGIWKAGPSQQGWSAAESNAINSQIINQAAVSGRNVQSAVGNAASDVGVGGGLDQGSHRRGGICGVTAGVRESLDDGNLRG